MPNVKPSLLSSNLEYLVTVGLVKVINLPGAALNVKHDGSYETITVEHLSNKK